jgi:hypothetical protein
MSNEIDIKIETVEVKGGEPIPLTVRNVFYKGFFGKIRTFFTWALYHWEDSFSEYLDSPVTYTRELPEDIDTYHGIDAEAELTKILVEEVNKAHAEHLRKEYLTMRVNEIFRNSRGYLTSEEIEIIKEYQNSFRNE